MDVAIGETYRVRRRFLPDSPFFQDAYDDRRRPEGHFETAIQRIDPRYFFRWNRHMGRWELWRFKDDLVRARVLGRSAEEICRVACYLCRIETEDKMYAPVDIQVVHYVWTQDYRRKYGTDDAVVAVDKIEDNERSEREDRNTRFHDNHMDLLRFNKRALYNLAFS